MELNCLVQTFNADLGHRFDVRLVGGGAEPFYRAPKNGGLGQIIFREDFIASALHEIAHWCLAGQRRRMLDDYGYWYVGDRTVNEQRNFERVEVRPQGLAWLFSDALGLPFSVSSDDPVQLPSPEFKAAVAEARAQLKNQMPPRAAQFIARISEVQGHKAG